MFLKFYIHFVWLSSQFLNWVSFNQIIIWLNGKNIALLSVVFADVIWLFTLDRISWKVMLFKLVFEGFHFTFEFCSVAIFVSGLSNTEKISSACAPHCKYVSLKTEIKIQQPHIVWQHNKSEIYNQTECIENIVSNIWIAPFLILLKYYSITNPKLSDYLIYIMSIHIRKFNRVWPRIGFCPMQRKGGDVTNWDSCFYTDWILESQINSKSLCYYLLWF